MNSVFIALVINFCAYCDMFKERAMEGIINSNDWDSVVVYNISDAEFEHGYIDNIEQYQSMARGYPYFISVVDGEVAYYWEGYTKDIFWYQYEKSK